MKKRKNNSVIILIFVILIIIGVIWFFNSKEQERIIKIDESQLGKESESISSLCFYRSIKNENGFYNVAYLKSNILNSKINGEFYHLPAETDSKIGTFEGEITQKEGESIASVWWNSLAEGMNIKEELTIKIREESATVGFGEMKDRGDGVYIYKDSSNLYFIENMPQIDCDILDEKLSVEKYLRENINKIATNNEILGENWYIVSMMINTSTKRGEIIYEDGHIQNKANISYSYNNITKEVKINSFEIIK
ncbi:MAG: hypothetical protein PHT84_01370 [Candidatus Pacebacteria bacterium]|nr:hypothetical protein [Candidatus Paceibacterota bacterium]